MISTNNFELQIKIDFLFTNQKTLLIYNIFNLQEVYQNAIPFLNPGALFMLMLFNQRKQDHCAVEPKVSLLAHWNKGASRAWDLEVWAHSFSVKGLNTGFLQAWAYI